MMGCKKGKKGWIKLHKGKTWKLEGIMVNRGMYRHGEVRGRGEESWREGQIKGGVERGARRVRGGACSQLSAEEFGR